MFIWIISNKISWNVAFTVPVLKNISDTHCLLPLHASTCVNTMDLHWLFHVKSLVGSRCNKARFSHFRLSSFVCWKLNWWVKWYMVVFFLPWFCPRSIFIHLDVFTIHKRSWLWEKHITISSPWCLTIALLPPVAWVYLDYDILTLNLLCCGII